MKKLLAITMALVLVLSLTSVASIGVSAAAKKGDANGDNSVDMKDVLVIRKYIANLIDTIDKTAADVNDDTSIDMKDVLQLRIRIAESDTLRVDKITEKVLNASPAVITRFYGTFNTTGAKHTYDYTPTVSERFSLFLTDMPEGMYQDIEIFNPAGNRVEYEWNRKNGETVSADLTAGQNYRFVITSDYACSYTLNVAYKKTVDVSNYTAIVDKMEYVNQKNTFTYTPKETGYVCLTLSGMPEGMEQSIYICNPAGQTIDYRKRSKNGDTVSATLTAGQTYRFVITSGNLCDYTLHVVHKDKVDVSGYKKVKDSVEHPGQHNIYLYTPSVSAKVYVYLGDMPEAATQGIKICNPAGQTIDYRNRSKNGDTVSATLTAGQTYEIVVSANDLCDYTLYIG